MAIAKMLRMKLVGINSEQEKLLDALHATGAVEIKSSQDFEGGEKITSDKTHLLNKQDRLEKALTLITAMAKENKKECEQPISDGFGVSYSDFVGVKKKEEEILAKADKVLFLNDEIKKLQAEIIALSGEVLGYAPYVNMKERFSYFVPTGKTFLRLGVIANATSEEFFNALSQLEYTQSEVICESESGKVVCVVALKENMQSVDKVLSEHSFAKCPFDEDITAAEKIEKLKKEESDKKAKIKEDEKEILSFVPEVYNFKLMSDYISYEKEKAVGGDQFARTKHTFLMEAYVPLERREQVEKVINDASGSVYTEFEELGEDDYAPTLMKNKKVASQFEFVTNMYSVPKYRSFDPNMVIAFFFSIFLGFITADAGYGLVMAVGGFVFAAIRKRKTGITKLANVVAWGGLASILFGVLFDSFFGIGLMRRLGWIDKTFLPDPIKDSSNIMGISVPTLLLISLGMGVIHIMTGLFINALISFKHGKVFDGICDGFTWIVFLAGLMLLVLSMTGAIPDITLISAIIMGVAVVFGALTAGRHEKGLGHFTKGFGAVYGLINYMSDILSYARLYGLMLSGSQIAMIVSEQLALPMLTSPGGVGGIIICALIMILGHAFNLAMGVLGAYIHDARLQYVEFFSHFYEGEGELFVPLGSRFDHIYLTEAKN